ncbi:hypothetical protein EJV22_13555 [Fictibacillus phosphorivorans]|nr:hypothetical protein [Fictibacillus phosphorivorans]
MCLIDKVDRSARYETPMGRAVRWRLLMAQSGRRLTARPMESEYPGTKINHFHELRSFKLPKKEQKSSKRYSFVCSVETNDLIRVIGPVSPVSTTNDPLLYRSAGL